jgi:hypothetical protein
VCDWGWGEKQGGKESKEPKKTKEERKMPFTMWKTNT